MNGTLCGLMVVMQTSYLTLVQNRDGVHNIVSAASRIVRTQTQLEDVLLASLMVKYGLVLKSTDWYKTSRCCYAPGVQCLRP